MAAGPLNPQCVMSIGPCSKNFVCANFICAFSTAIPSNPFNENDGTLNVNSDGTGEIISCPSCLIQLYEFTLGEPPVAIKK